MESLLAGHDVGFVLGLVAALLLTGVFAGLVAGLLGVGGGIVSTPILFYLFGLVGVGDAVRMHLAVGTSLALIVPTAVISTLAHETRGAVDRAILRSWGPPMLAGVLLGILVAGAVAGIILTLAFAVVALLVASTLVLGRPEGLFGTRLPGWPLKDGLAALIGLVSVMVGVGSGALAVPVMSAFGYPIHRAIGTSAATGLIVAVPGALAFAWMGLDTPGRTSFCLGFVHLPALAFMLPAAMAVAPWGARLAHLIRPQHLRVVFAAFLVVIAGRMLYDLGS